MLQNRQSVIWNTVITTNGLKVTRSFATISTLALESLKPIRPTIYMLPVGFPARQSYPLCRDSPSQLSHLMKFWN
jgi:hypothetical protein